MATRSRIPTPSGARLADLVLVNLKVADFIGHAYGPERTERRAGRAESPPMHRMTSVIPC